MKILASINGNLRYWSGTTNGKPTYCLWKNHALDINSRLVPNVIQHLNELSPDDLHWAEGQHPPTIPTSPRP